jgi:ribonuclease HII
MVQLGTEFPEYEWHNNKGYPTADHLDAIRRVGVSIHHRRNVDLVIQLEKDHGEYKKETL